MEGYWRLQVKWPGHPETIVNDIELNFHELEDAVKVLKKYMGYTEAVITYIQFDDPSRW